MRTMLKPGFIKILVTFALFALSSYLWRMYVLSTISDTFPWGFPLQFYLAWGPCPPGELCSESNIFFLIIDIMLWYTVSGFFVSRIARGTAH